MNWIISSLAGLVSGIFSSMGLGAGTVLLLYLSLFTDTPQLTSQGINLIFFLPCAAVALFFHFKSKLIRWRSALLCSLGGVFGVLSGVYFSNKISVEWLSKIFSVFLFIIGIREVFMGIKDIKKKKTVKKTLSPNER